MIFLSPGVKSEEKDYSTYVSQISSCILGIVGGGSKGEIGKVTHISSVPLLIENFGEPQPDDYGILAAIEFLKRGNQLYYYRAAESTAAKSFLDVMDGLITFTAKDFGTDGDFISVEISDVGPVTAKVTIYVKGTAQESFDFSLDRSREDFIENIDFYWVEATYNEDVAGLPEIAEFVNSFVQDEEDSFVLTSTEELKQMEALVFATENKAVVESVKLVGDSYGILQPGDLIASGKADKTTTTITFVDKAKLVIPEKKVKDLKVSKVTVADITDAVSYNAYLPEAYTSAYPYSGPSSAPLSGNPWLVTEFETEAAVTEVKFMVYKKSDHTVSLPVEIQIKKVPTNNVKFRAGKNYMMFEFLKSRPECDTLNIDPNSVVAGTYVLRLDIIEDNKVVQRLEKDFEIDLSELLASLVGASALVTPDIIPEVSEENTEDGLRVLTFDVLIRNAFGSNREYAFRLEPSDRIVEEYTGEKKEYPIPLPNIVAFSQANLSGGVNGLPLDPKTVVKALQPFRDTDSLTVNLIAAPGFWQSSVVTELIDVATSRADCFAIIDPPQGLSPQQVADWHNGKLEGDSYLLKALDTSYGGLYYPWVKVTNMYSGEDIWCPPSGVVAGAFAYNDNEANPWFAPAGLNRGMLSSVIQLERSVEQGQRDLLYGNGNAVNSLVNYQQQGITIWGQKTLQRKSSALDRVNVRRLLNMVRKSIAASTAYLVFEQNDEKTWRRWVGMIEPYLETLKTSRALYAYLVEMNENTVTPYYQDRNEMPGNVYLQPTKTAEFIPISFILKSTGASFTDD